MQDLVIDVLGSTDSITVQGWFGTDASAKLSEIKLLSTSGTVVTEIDAGLASLVAAMANYSSANSGFNPTAANTVMPTDPTLQGVISSSWHH